MTDKELKKLSRLELLELLLNESRENERLRTELDKLKNENSVQKSAQHLNEASDKMNESLQNAAVLADTLNRLIAGKIVVSEIINEPKTDTPEDISEEEENEEASSEDLAEKTDTTEEADAENTISAATEEAEEQSRENTQEESQENTQEPVQDEQENKPARRNSVDVQIYTRLMSYFHKNRYALAFIPEDIKIDIEKRLEEIINKK